MLLPPYLNEELTFAFCYHVYFRWHTHMRRPVAAMRALAAAELQAVHPEIHILQLESSDVEMSVLASLRPSESVSTAASKLKGAAGKLLRVKVGDAAPPKIIGGGYFACTCGPATREELDRYLDEQPSHHGYDPHPSSPVFQRTWPESESDDRALEATHASTIVQFHLVLATWNRQGVFACDAAEAVTECWEKAAVSWLVGFSKVSFVADHVHVAVRAHPTVVPGQVVLSMLNTSQQLIAERFPHLLVQATIPRLWKPSGYVGTFGELSNSQVQSYLRRWGASTK